MKSYSCVIFDLDGTLMDTSRGIIQATDFIIEKFQLPIISEDVKRSFIGPPIQKSIQLCYGIEQEQAWEIATVWRDAYKDKFLFEAYPYDGIYELLKILRKKKIKVCVATNKREDYAMRLLDYFSFTPWLDFIVGSDFAGKLSKTDMIQLCMKKTKMVDPAQCLMIGDTNGDMVAAQKCGIDFIGVTYGFGFKDEEASKFEFNVVKSTRDILDMVCR